jgi:hypothetical protein
MVIGAAMIFSRAKKKIVDAEVVEFIMKVQS